MRIKGKQGLRRLHRDCAGIDIGGDTHWVAVDPELTEEPVKSFGSFTDELNAMADWLQAMKVKRVAMEATGVYWIPVYELLESRGFEVDLVNARATRQVTGRKSDVLDCQWIQQLPSYGLLRGAFRPPQQVCAMRALVRQRAIRVSDQARAMQHMQKALTQMNVQLTCTVTDLGGKTGMAILRAIAGGERDPQRLAQLRDGRLKADEATLARSLEGTWREEHIFALQQALAHYDFLSGQIAQCEERIAQSITGLAQRQDAPAPATKDLRSTHRTRGEDETLRQGLYRMLGVDLTAIPTIAVETTLVVASEIGPDLRRFPTCEQFCSWLSLAPPTRISGGKPLPGKTHTPVQRAGQALRMAASNALRSKSYIGAVHRGRLTRMDKPRAIKATAHQLARLIYAMLTKGQAYVEKGMIAYEEQSHDRQVRSLLRKAHRLGLQVVESEKAAFA
jgi:transposase